MKNNENEALINSLGTVSAQLSEMVTKITEALNQINKKDEEEEVEEVERLHRIIMNELYQNFEWAKTLKMMKAVNWVYAGTPVTTEAQIKEQVSKIVKEALKLKTTIMTAGFKVEYRSTEDSVQIMGMEEEYEEEPYAYHPTVQVEFVGEWWETLPDA